VEEGALALSVDEYDRGGGGDLFVPYDTATVDAPLVEESDEEVAEGIGADLTGHGGSHTEADKSAGGVERTPAAVQGDLVDERERTPRGELLDRTGDCVGDEDSEADDVDHGVSTT
jgi:hypothetical protein